VEALERRRLAVAGRRLCRWTAACLLAISLGGCGSGREDPELAAANAWLQQVKAERLEDAEWLSNECVAENGFPLTRDGIIAHVDCMKRKDEQQG
jgi:hypothetical protein